MTFVRSICLIALSWIPMNYAMDKVPEIEFKGTIAEFKKHFGQCDFTQNVDSAPNFEDYLFGIAFEKGNLSVARWFVQHGCNLHKLYKNGCQDYRDTSKPPLIAAVENGHLPVVNLLLAMGASPDGVRCPNTMSCNHQRGPANDFLCKNIQALPLALYNRQNTIAQMLIDAGAERYWSGEIKSAVNGGNLQRLEALDTKYDSWSFVRSAIAQNNPRMVRIILNNLTEHSKKYMPSEDYYGFNYATLVVESILNDNPEITRMLLDAQPSFDVNCVSQSFRGPHTRPIIAAIQKGNLAQVQDLIKRGAWINPIFPERSPIEYDSIEGNPLYAAAYEDNIEAVEFLLQQGALPTHLACYHGSVWGEPMPVIEFIRQFQGWKEYHGLKQRPNLNSIIQILEDHMAKQKP